MREPATPKKPPAKRSAPKPKPPTAILLPPGKPGRGHVTEGTSLLFTIDIERLDGEGWRVKAQWTNPPDWVKMQKKHEQTWLVYDDALKYGMMKVNTWVKALCRGVTGTFTSSTIISTHAETP